MLELDNMLKTLNPEQREAVEEFKRPLLVLSGAGSGKTRVITTKIAYAIERLNIDPYNILAVTFTNKAANEMRERVYSMLGDNPAVKYMQIKTFHSFGTFILRREGEKVGVIPNFTILTDTDSASLVKQLFPEYPKEYISKAVKIFLKAKDQGLKPGEKDLTDMVKKYLHANPQSVQTRDNGVMDITVEAVLSFYKSYERKLREIGNVDFSDLLVLPLTLFKEYPEVKRKYQDRFQVVLVDEYQDSNSTQFRLLKELYAPENFLCVVGDDDQSIYGFRGAKISNILNFPQQFKDTHIVTLNENYRCSKNILDLATNVIERNTQRHKKDLRTSNNVGAKIDLYKINSEMEEAHQICKLIKNSGDYKNTAILYRTNAQSRPFEQIIKTVYNIDYNIIGSKKFYDREEVKDGLALILLTLNPNDPISFGRVVNKPPRGIGKVSLQAIHTYVAENKCTYLEACKNMPKINIKLASFVNVFDEASQLRQEGKPNTEIVKHLFKASGLVKYFEDIDDKDKTFKKENIESLVTAIQEYSPDLEGLIDFLEELTLDPNQIAKESEEAKSKDGVTMITMHNTKGLEFDNVYLVGVEKDTIPSFRSRTAADFEEERRIFYVAITRARKKLVMSYCMNRMKWGTNKEVTGPSMFIDEMDKSLVQLHEVKSHNSNQNRTNGYLGWKRQYNTEPTRKPKNSYFSGGYSSVPKEENKVDEISNSTYKKGDLVEHSEYGKAVVTNVKSMAGKELVELLCTNGRPVTVIDLTVIKKI